MLRSSRLAVSLAVLGALSFGSAANAAAPGLNVVNYSDARVALNEGAKQVRFFVRWSDFEAARPEDFDKSGPKAADRSFADALKANSELVRAAGATPIMVVVGAPAWAASGKRPRSATEYGAFVGELAEWLKPAAGQPANAIEIWNEPDAPEFWGEAPDASFYTSMLKASHAAIKAGDPGAVVLTGPTTGNNFGWIEALYANGAKGSFDGVAVHTDTACSVVGPDTFYREPSGRLGQFTFLGYREIRATMLANGDPKPIWMTELGWSTTNGDATSCARGEQAGKKPSGVSEADQAAFLRKAFECLALDDYVVAASVFTLRDAAGRPQSEELSNYGLFRRDGAAKPALEVFKGASGIAAGSCGDFEAPQITVTKPTEGEQFVDRIEIRASASDAGVGLGRITFAYDGGQQIRNFTEALTNGASVGLAPWFGSRELAVGPHRIEVSALDKNGNVGQKVVNVVKVPATGVGALPQTLTPRYRLARKATCAKKRVKGKRTCVFKGRLSRPTGSPAIGGSVAVEWQFLNKKKQWRKLVGGLKSAGKPFTFKAKLKNKGRWRVRATYKGVAPYKPVRSKYLTFRVR